MMRCWDCGEELPSEYEGYGLCHYCARDREEGENQEEQENPFDAQEETVEDAEEEAFEAEEREAESAKEETKKARPLQRFTPEDVIKNPEIYCDTLPVDLALAFNKRFLRLPQTWVKGGIPALMDRASPGLWRLFTQLWHYGNLPRGLIFPSKGTLAREAGFKSLRTLDRKLEILETGDPQKGLPAVLERISLDGEYEGHRIAYIFKRESIAHLQQIAEANIEADQRRRAAISKAREKAGRKGSQKRWR